jgi:hypothetical protein
MEVVIATPGSMLTGGPAKAAAAFERVLAGTSPGRRELYGDSFGAFAARFNERQTQGLASTEAARRVIAMAERTPAPTRAAVGPDAERILAGVRENSEEELDDMRRHIAGLDRWVTSRRKPQPLCRPYRGCLGGLTGTRRTPCSVRQSPTDASRSYLRHRAFDGPREGQHGAGAVEAKRHRKNVTNWAPRLSRLVGWTFTVPSGSA